MYKVNQHSQPTVVFVQNPDNTYTATSFELKFKAQILTTTPEGIEREQIVSAYESQLGLPGVTLDESNTLINPRPTRP